MIPDRCLEPPPPALLEGIDEFNARRFYQCHEVLEDLWREEREPIRQLYQGILQIGVAFYHLGRGNYAGAMSLVQSGMKLVRPFGPRCLSVEVEKLLKESSNCRARLEELGPERASLFDWSIVPTIQVAEGGPPQ